MTKIHKKNCQIKLGIYKKNTLFLLIVVDMNKDVPINDAVVANNQCEDNELDKQIKLLEKRRADLEKEEKRKRIKELKTQIGLLSDPASAQQQRKPTAASKEIGKCSYVTTSNKRTQFYLIVIEFLTIECMVLITNRSSC